MLANTDVMATIFKILTRYR